MKRTLILCAILLMSCINDSEDDFFDSIAPDNFKLVISAKDESDDPISDIDIFIKYQASDSLEHHLNNLYDLSRQNSASTNIDFILSRKSLAKLDIYDLHDNLIESLIDSVLDYGHHSAIYSYDSELNATYPTGIKIFRYQLQAFDDNSNEKLFDESKYMIILDGIYDQNQIELSDTKIGSTDSNGIYETESSIWFPTLYSLPEISITDELDIYYGLLDISSPYFNNIKISLLDSINMIGNSISATLSQGYNEFEILCSSLSSPSMHDADINTFDDVYIDDLDRRSHGSTSATIMFLDSSAFIYSNGYIGAVQMTLSHGDDFSIDLTDNAFAAEYVTEGNQTTLVIAAPEGEELFSFSGEMNEVLEVQVANESELIYVNVIFGDFILMDNYPNPFN